MTAPTPAPLTTHIGRAKSYYVNGQRFDIQRERWSNGAAGFSVYVGPVADDKFCGGVFSTVAEAMFFAGRYGRGAGMAS